MVMGATLETGAMVDLVVMVLRAPMARTEKRAVVSVIPALPAVTAAMELWAVRQALSV
jgi:hypothetical protein